LREKNEGSHLKQSFSFSGVGVVDILLPLQEGVLVHDVHLVAVDEGAQQQALREVLLVTKHLESISTCINFGRKLFGQHFILKFQD
jgi:hypothetical protein